jgi:hypothetical protein
LYLGGYLRAVSVGCRPIDAPTCNKENGLDFKTVELLEVSAVPVPANPDALRKSLASHSSDVTERQAREIIEAAYDRAGLANKQASVDETTARRIIERAIDVDEVAQSLKQVGPARQ